MKKIAYLIMTLFLVSPVLMSCRDENTVEVEQLEPDADDDEESYDTNPTEEDPD